MSGITLTISLGGMPVDKMEETPSGQSCPPATQDINLNLENRKKAIDEYDYGPLNPGLDYTGQNDKFWMKIANEFNTDIDSALESRCGNCAAFNLTSRMQDCIAEGIGDDGSDPYDAVDAGDLGFCKFLKFKCASERACTAWVSGGPIDDESQKASEKDIL